MNRRHILLGSGIGAASLLGAYGWSQYSADDLSQLGSMPRLQAPPLLDSTTSGSFSLTAMAGETNFLGKAATGTMGYNRAYLGPTLRLNTGVTAAEVNNATDEPVTVHWHGLMVPGSQDGGPHRPIATGETWNPDLDLDQPPCTAWYHTHIHGRTATQVHSGLAGAIVLTDGKDRQRGLPDTYGTDDLMLVIQDRRFDSDGRMVYGRSSMDLMHGFSGDTVLVNGQAGTVAAVPKGIVRLRLLNGSNARIYSLFLSDGRPMHLIATDGGYLRQTIALDEVRLAPGERAEVLVDFGNGNPVALKSRPDPNSGPGGMMGRVSGLVNKVIGSSFTVLPFAVDDRIQANVSAIPTDLDGVSPSLDGSGANERRMSLDMTMGPAMMTSSGGTMAINGRPFDMRRLDFDIPLGAIERWRIESSIITHPFHVHGAVFQVVGENGQAPRPENIGWKDTVVVNGETEILIRFDQPADRINPFMAHCHILEHEDAGMMAQFTVG